MKFLKYLKVNYSKIAAICLAVCAIIAGAVSAITESAIRNKYAHPFVLIIKNGKDKSLDSKWRLLNRHQAGYINRNFDDKLGGPVPPTWETELGVQLDNSNPIVQAEQLNWLYYLLFYGQIKNSKDGEFKASNSDFDDNVSKSNFDGIRIDSSDAVDSDVLAQTGDLLDDLYGRNSSDANANDHLSFNEGYGPKDSINEKKYFHNASLNYDDSYYQQMTASLMWYDDKKAPDLNNAYSKIVNWEDDETENVGIPNLTYSQNHDNFNGKVLNIAGLMQDGISWKHFNNDKLRIYRDAAAMYYKNLSSKDKTYKGVQITPKNQITLYADMLTNKDTVPIVFYGDIFEGEKDYMTTPTSIAQPIMDILDARSKYVAGGQQRRAINDGSIVTNVRFGKGYYENKPISDQDFEESKKSGIATIYSNNKNVDVNNLKVYVGKNHANENYINLIDTSENDPFGLTLGNAVTNPTDNTVMGVDNKNALFKTNNDKPIKVDENGFLTLNVKGMNTPFVDGYLSMWVPEGEPGNVYVSEDEAKTMHSEKATHETLNSNAALDSHVVFQDFAVVLPNQGLYKNEQKDDMYAKLKEHAADIAKSGVTDVWMAPPYISSDLKKQGQTQDWAWRYGYGYMMSDRYNLGEEDTPSKYGTSSQLIDATNALHNNTKEYSRIKNRGLKTILDFVPHQIVRGDVSEEVTFDEYNSPLVGEELALGRQNITRKLKTATSDSNFQHKFGGKYLSTINELFPKLFTTSWLSTGEKIPYDMPITNWSAKYEDAYPLEFGIDDSEVNDYLSKNVQYDVEYLTKRDE